MEPALAVVVLLSAFGFLGLTFAQSLSSDRLGINYLVRDLANEPSVKYLADTTLDRFIDHAHRITKLALGAATDFDLDTIVTDPKLTRYALNTDATHGSVVSVFYREEEIAGHEEWALSYVPPEMIGQAGDAPPGDHYTVLGNEIAISKSPNGNDTLFIYYTDYADTLSEDDSPLDVAKEDEMAVALLTLSLVKMRDHQSALAQLAYQMWKDELAIKGVGLPQRQQQ